MTRQATLPQLKKYDVNQKILETLANAEARFLLFSVIKEEKSAADLSRELRIPITSVYKKLAVLEDLALVTVRSLFDHNHKKYKIYKSRISRATIYIKEPEAQLILIGIDEAAGAADSLHDKADQGTQ